MSDAPDPKRIADLVSRAVQGDAEPLCQYVLSNAPLPKKDWKNLASLIQRALRPQKKKGRPPGRTPGAVPNAERLVALYVQRRQHEWRETEDRERVPKILTRGWIEEAIKRREEEFPEVRGKLSVDDIENRMLKTMHRGYLLGPRRKQRLLEKEKQRALEGQK